MNDYYLTFRSITYAQRGEQVIQRKGFSCKLQRTPRFMEERGCGYCLRIKTADIHPCVEALGEQDLPWRRCYLRKADGRYEEVTL